MVEDDEVAVLEVEAVEFVARALGVHHVFVDHEGRALGVACYALADLSYGSEFALEWGWMVLVGGLFLFCSKIFAGSELVWRAYEEVEEVVGGDVVGEILDEECSGGSLVRAGFGRSLVGGRVLPVDLGVDLGSAAHSLDAGFRGYSRWLMGGAETAEVCRGGRWKVGSCRSTRVQGAKAGSRTGT